MNEVHDKSDQHRRVQELLLGYLIEADAPHWPGVDGMTLDEVLHYYPQAAREGLVPDLSALRQGHPELAEILDDLFAD